eukprot:7542659-Alexandrium_andersonii.AAC.1
MCPRTARRVARAIGEQQVAGSKAGWEGPGLAIGRRRLCSSKCRAALQPGFGAVWSSLEQFGAVWS